MLSDKDIIGSIEAIKDEIEEWHVAPLDDARAACLEKLKNCFKHHLSLTSTIFPSFIKTNNHFSNLG
jgi:folylpolyglutamate synthase/dihydropteroate synthase